MKYTVQHGVVRKIKTSVINTAMSLVLLTSTMSGALPLLFSQHAFADSPTVVTPANPQNWYLYNDQSDSVVSNTSDHGFVNGPATPPAGTGSVHLTKTTNDSYGVATNQFVGTSLSSILHLSYATYRASGTSAQAPSLGFDVDSDTTDASTAYQGRLTYEPYFTHTVDTGSWQTWNTQDDAGTGNWWFSHATLSNGAASVCTQSDPCTWSELTTAYPHAGISGRFILRTNGATNEAFDGNVDDLTLNNTTYDFEPTVVPPCSSDNTTFDTFNDGSVNGQHGWSSTGNYDQAVVDNTYGINSFGCKSLRISNAVTNGAFGDQTFSYSTPNEAGETSATNGGMSGGTRQSHYDAQFNLASTQSTQQSGLSLSVAPDRGDGSRMSYLRFEDQSDGVHVFFDDVTDPTHAINGDTFNETDIATLSRTAPHTIKFSIDFNDGPDNDVVKVYIDGSLAKTGTTWEDYYRYDTESNSEPVRTVDSLLFRAGGTAAPATSGNGFLFDNVDISTSSVAPAAPTNLRFENPSIPCGGSTNVNHTTAAWDAVPGALSYDYHVDGPNGLTYDTNLTGTSNTGSFGAGDEGTYTFMVRSVGSSGVKSDWSSSCAITYDPTAPTDIQNLSPANNANLNTHDFTFDWSDSSDSNGVKYQWEASLSNTTSGGSFTNILASHTTTASEVGSPGTPDGVYYWHVRAIDPAGNTSAWTPIWKVTVDTNAPAVPNSLGWKTSSNVTVPNNGNTNQQNGTASWTGDNDADHYVYKSWDDISGDPYNAANPYTTTVNSTSLPGSFSQGQGTYHFAVSACDAAGNCSPFSSTFTITYDATAPTGLANQSPADGTHTTTANQTQITWTPASDANGPITYYYESSLSSATNGDGSFVNPVYGPASTGSDTFINTPNTPTGTYFWHVKAVDAAGNSTTWTDAWQIVVDNSAPVVTVNNLTTTDTTPTLTGTVDDSNATITVSVNGHTYNATVTGNTWSADVTDALPANTYNVVATATDQAGNVGNDITTDELTITAVPAAPTTTNTITVTNFSSQFARSGSANSTGNTNGGNANSGNASNTNNTSTGVLGTSQGTGSSSNVKGAKTVTVKNAADQNDGKLLGLGWWWLAVAGALAAFWWILVARRRSEEN